MPPFYRYDFLKYFNKKASGFIFTEQIAQVDEIKALFDIGRSRTIRATKYEMGEKSGYLDSLNIYSFSIYTTMFIVQLLQTDSSTSA